MVKVDRKIFLGLIVIGAVLLLTGYSGYIELIGLNKSLSIALYVIGFILLMASMIFVCLENSKLYKESRKIEKIEKFRELSSEVKDNSCDGYILDMTGDTPKDVVRTFKAELEDLSNEKEYCNDIEDRQKQY